MPIPPPQYDTVLIREHLYQDLKHKWLVIPPQSNDPGFRPVHEIGLGLSEYKLVDTDQISFDLDNSSAYNYSYIQHIAFVIMFSLIFFFIGRLIMKQFISSSSQTNSPIKARTPIPEKLDFPGNGSFSPFSYSNDLEEGNMQGLGLTTPHSHTANSSISSLPPSLVNTPSTPAPLSSPSVSETSLKNFGLETSLFSIKQSILPTKVIEDPTLMSLMGSNLKLQ